jgi:signal transduction histidine kinase/ligand-binding sensor domain-containing protein
MRIIARYRYQVHQFLLFTCLLIVPLLTAQAERLPVKIYTSADGLGSSFINNLMRDSRGFMWFCTRDGLSRFDGARFVTYRVGDKNAPPSIEGITETRDGSYWITTTSGLYRFKADAVSRPDLANRSRPTLNAEFISILRGPLLEDREGNLWYGGGALYHLEEQDGRFLFQQVELNLPVPPNRRAGVLTMREADDGSLWLNTSAGLVRRLPDGRLIYYPAESTPTYDNSMCLVDSDQRVWYVVGLELYVLKPERLESLTTLGRITVKPLKAAYTLPAKTEKEIRLPEKEGELIRFTGKDFLARDPAHRLCQTSDKHIWLTSDRELIEFDGRVFHRFTVAQGLMPGMLSMAEDSAGNLWIGGKTALIRLDRRGLTSYGEADGLHSASVHAINEGKDGTLYFADGDFYLAHFNGKSFETTRPTLPPGSRILWTSRYAFLDSRDEWWILTNEKLYLFAASNLKKPLASYTSSDGLKAGATFQIFEDKRGDIWVSVQSPNPDSNGLARYERAENRFHTLTEGEGFPPGRSVSSFAEDNNGNIWLGFYEGGLARYANGGFTVFDTADNLPEGVITDLQVGRNGQLWISSSGGGVSRIDDPCAEEPSFAPFTTSNGLSSNNIRTITEDHFGNIYFGTVRGVDRVSPDTNYIRHYSVSDGLAGDFVVDSHCDKNGVLWFATTNGLSRLVPTADETHAPPPTWLGGLRIAGVAQALPELGVNEINAIELSDIQNNLQLDFFGVDFHASETLRYQYKLEGADTDWSLPSEQRTITLANLSSGSYRFLVRAINSDGTISSRPASVTFKILPPIWLRWWFITLSATLAAAAVYALFRYRVNRLLEIERVRTRIAADLHDDIGASLSRMAVLSEVVKRQTEVDHRESADMLTAIADSARGLVDSMSDIVWSIDPRKDDLKNVVLRIRQFASDVLEARAIAWEFKAPEKIDHVKMSPEQRRHLFLIFKEAINNVARHSECRSVSLDISVLNGRLVAEIRDDGRGFAIKPAEESHTKESPTKESHTNGRGGNGLGNMHARAAEIGARLKIVSSPGGTQLFLVLPLKEHSYKQGA